MKRKFKNIQKMRIFFGIIICLGGFIPTQIIQVVQASSQQQQIRDIAITGLDYNTEVYLGSEIAFQAYIKDEPDFAAIRWSTNKNGIIELKGQAKQAQLQAIQPGQVEIAACVDDETWSCIHRNIFVKNYENDTYHQQWLAPGMRAVQKVGLNQQNLYIEVVPGQAISQQEQSLKGALQQLASLGTVTLETVSELPGYYTFFTFNVTNRAEKLTVRVNRTAHGWQEQQQILTNYMEYLEGKMPDPESSLTEPDNNLPNQEEQHTLTPDQVNTTPPQQQIPVQQAEYEQRDVTLGFSELIQDLDENQDGTKANPFRVRFRQESSRDQQYQIFQEYLLKWSQRAEVKLHSQQQVDGETRYLFEILEAATQQAFYLEFILDDESGENAMLLAPLLTSQDGESSEEPITTTTSIVQVRQTLENSGNSILPLIFFIAQIGVGGYLLLKYRKMNKVRTTRKKG